VQLRIEIDVEGPAGQLLDDLVGRLSLAPGVRALSWQADTSAPYDDESVNNGDTHHPPRWWRLRWPAPTTDDPALPN
jgi:hypothetical protein